MARDDWDWAVTNIGPSTLFVWLEPWAEEFEVAARSTIALDFHSEDSTQMDITGERIVVWAEAGQTVRVFIDSILQESASASLPVPGGFNGSTKNLLNLMFGGQPTARLGGKDIEPKRRDEA